MISRVLFNKLQERFHNGKAIILIGPRQVGKTTLIHAILKGKKHIFLNADDPSVKKLLTNPNTEQIKGIIGGHDLIFIDEAQRIENIGITLKLITDQFKHVQLIVSGSSAFELNSKLNEPLTGRKWEYRLYPISWREFQDKVGYLVAEQQLKQRLVFGMYPDVINRLGDEVEVLKNLTDSYLFKDILALGNIRKPDQLEKLLNALAYQMGNEVSFNELSQLLGIDKNTVSNYVTVLEQAFVILRLGSFSTNLRNEIKTNQKIYFYDNGIRNAVIGNFDSFDSRADKGALWENFLVMERIKKLAYENSLNKYYFWRTKQQQEVDFVEKSTTAIMGFEFKWNPKSNPKFPKTFIKAYDADIKVIHQDNFREFVL